MKHLPAMFIAFLYILPGHLLDSINLSLINSDRMNSAAAQHFSETIFDDVGLVCLHIFV